MEINRFVKKLSFCPDRLCGAEALPLIALGAGSAALSLASSSSTNSSNWNINAANRNFSAKEAEKQRQWQSDEWTRQYNIQRDEWYNQLKAYQQTQWEQYMQQFNNESSYNKPVNQVARMKEAGLNPSAVLGQGSTGLVSAASGNLSNVGSPSVPSGGPVSGAAASAPSSIPMQQSSVLASMGSVLRDLAAASKDNKLTEPMVNLIGSQLIGQELQNQWQLFENDVLAQTKDVKVRQAFADLRLSFADFSVKSAMVENYSADTVLKSAEAALAVAKERCSSKEYEEIEFRVAHMFETWRAEIDVKKSQKVQNYASAGLSNALAKTEDDMRKFRVANQDLLNSYQKLMNGIQANNYKVSDATVDQQIKTTSTELFERAKREGILTKEAQLRAEQAIKENDWWLFEHILFPVIGMVNDNDQNRRDRAADVVTAGFSKKK